MVRGAAIRIDAAHARKTAGVLAAVADARLVEGTGVVRAAGIHAGALLADAPDGAVTVVVAIVLAGWKTELVSVTHLVSQFSLKRFLTISLFVRSFTYKTTLEKKKLKKSFMYKALKSSFWHSFLRHVQVLITLEYSLRLMKHFKTILCTFRISYDKFVLALLHALHQWRM